MGAALSTKTLLLAQLFGIFDNLNRKWGQNIRKTEGKSLTHDLRLVVFCIIARFRVISSLYTSFMTVLFKFHS